MDKHNRRAVVNLDNQLSNEKLVVYVGTVGREPASETFDVNIDLNTRYQLPDTNNGLILIGAPCNLM